MDEALRLRLRSLTQASRLLRPSHVHMFLLCSVLFMPGVDVLSSYPYVVVRIACRRCTRKGSYRLARLAAKYGAEIPMMELLAHLAGDCAIWDTRHPGAPRCAGYFVDLEFPAPPPDRPTEGCAASASSKAAANGARAPKKSASASSQTSTGRQAEIERAKEARRFGIGKRGLSSNGTENRHNVCLPPFDGNGGKRSTRAPKDQAVPAHSTTSSAAASRVCGMSIPRALAVLRLTIVTNLIGRSIGRSPGCAPLRILSTKSAMRSPASKTSKE